GRRAKAADASGVVVENAALLLKGREPRFWIGAVAIAEEAFEHHARIDFHRKRSRGAAPGKRIGVGAAISGIASARQRRAFEADLEGRQLRDLAQFSRRDLVSRDARADACPFGLLGMGARKPGSAFARMIARAVS